ncbi:MAG TPA: NADH-quinone oxidoreductase subunit N [Polyangia bacterium]|jgi:NADH-quinone oxidoreductase subunit N
MSFDASVLLHQLPLLTVVFFGLVVLLLETFARAPVKAPAAGEAAYGAGPRGYLMHLAVAGCVIALGLTGWSAVALEPRSLYDGMLAADRYTRFFEAVFLCAGALSLLLSHSWMREHDCEFGEFYALILFAIAGMMILAAATDLVTVFLGLETMSVAIYVLVGSRLKAGRSAEAALKYYLVGAFSAAILLYGIALVYGATGTTSLTGIAAQVSGVSANPIFILGLVLLLCGLAYKVAAVPFHMWTPDAYEGAPTPVTAFMAAGVKAAAFAALVRVLTTAFNLEAVKIGTGGWVTILQVLAVLTMTLGNIAALRQENVKRLLAYSAISHAGYVLVGVVAVGVVGKEAQPPVLYYLLAYTFSTIGAFGVVAWLGSRNDERLMLDDWAGLSSRHPLAALAMTLFLLSLAGVPPTAGFFAKFYVLRAATMDPQLYPLVVIAVLNSVVAAFYYLKVIMAMYFRELAREPRPQRSPAMVAALVIAVLLVLQMGLMPGLYLTAAGH